MTTQQRRFFSNQTRVTLAIISTIVTLSLTVVGFAISNDLGPFHGPEPTSVPSTFTSVPPTPPLTVAEASQKLYGDIRSTPPTYNWPLTYNQAIDFAGPFALVY